ncbi:glycosyltransferase [Buttiauxella ferragutiae ATCC 51602]|uniref:Glycosyltransferase n=1 Tax=Buttiauxella ferragutiae ATCC 51602 TaxID=1354252 RepID=A0ABX2W861_9ENTR|nr:glycosyltransferase [Buttiauxella ferragutiae]OAT26972.1 glycosyltransferase [Buttiauxella ferragutiae ATCC 51602]
MISNEFRFSVLISLYYKELPQHLNRCLESLYDQELNANEVVCVFDGPINKELESVVSLWKDKLNIVIVNSLENIGLGRALNLGLSHCSYNIVARMDTDDISTSERFLVQVPMLYNDPSLAIVGSNIAEFETDELLFTGRRVVPESEAEIRTFCKFKSPFNHMTVVYRKDVIEKVGGYIHHLNMEDYNLWLRVLYAGYSTRNINKELVKARVGREMLRRRSGFKYIQSEYQLAKLKYDLNIQCFLMVVLVFIARAGTRILPIKVLHKIYQFNRVK